uniref:ATP synthase subunit a n=1 Tax=Bovicola ovis TaxID=186214 RepID=A0A386B280_9NEOP|nr:ATP synthase F0 subunit 6 [Bovicola ovis]
MNCSLLSSFDPCLSSGLGLGLGKFLLISALVGFLPYSSFRVLSGPKLFIWGLLNFMRLSFSDLFPSKAPISGLVGLFVMLLICNFLGLLPFSFSLTSHMCVNLSAGLLLWMSGVVFSILSMGYLWAFHFVPQGAPTILVPFLCIVEFISTVIRPLSLSVRLMSNMIAGHMILGLMWNVMWEGGVVLLLSISLLSGGFLLFEFGVSIIQAFVFSTLTSLYWEESTH